jgi:hypothetical protein
VKHVERQESCLPPQAASLENPPTGDMAGEYALTMVATTGPESKRRVGKMWLTRTDAAHRHPLTSTGATMEEVVIPYFGSVEIELEEVGALEVGDASSRDPDEPGVLWLEQRLNPPEGPASITLRLGSLANRKGAQEFDGSYTALHVHEVSLGRFAGKWVSGSMGQQTIGYFCAERVSVRHPQSD